MRIDLLRSWAAPLFLLCCLILGGASGRGAGALANGLLQGMAILVIAILVWGRRNPIPRSARQMMAIGGAFLLVVVISLIPLPGSLWAALPGREAIANGYRLLDMELPALPLTLSWNNSLASILWLLPPAAMFVLTVQASPAQRTRMIWVALGLMGVSIVLGVAQLLGGSDSALYFYRITNSLSPVGFFANTNHLAILLVCGLPLVGCLAGRAYSGKSSKAQRHSMVIIAVAIGILLVAGIGITGSQAGFGLTLPGALAAFIIYRKAATGKVGRGWAVGLVILFVAFVAVALAGPLNRQSLSEETSGGPSSRGYLAATTVNAIEDVLPVGSGLGTFQEVYRMYDDPNLVRQEFTNHAHNDYLELVLELGVAGALLILAFLIWWLVQSLAAWKATYQGVGLARAGSVIIFVLLMHSLVDYPLRTSALAALFALGCGFLVPYSRISRDTAPPVGDETLRHLKA